jgi:hypothetical protein
MTSMTVVQARWGRDVRRGVKTTGSENFNQRHVIRSLSLNELGDFKLTSHAACRMLHGSLIGRQRQCSVLGRFISFGCEFRLGVFDQEIVLF